MDPRYKSLIQETQLNLLLFIKNLSESVFIRKIIKNLVNF